jgi:hypothetical protein
MPPSVQAHCVAIICFSVKSTVPPSGDITPVSYDGDIVGQVIANLMSLQSFPPPHVQEK